jgi:Ca2+-binding EF-hand superfamily protein
MEDQMKHAFLLVFGLSCAFAQEQHEHDGGPRRAPGGPMRSPAMRVLDIDKDGALSATEIQQAAANLAKLDQNQDGKLTEDELRPAGGPAQANREGGRGPGQRRDLVGMLMQFDKDGDGSVSKAEVPERMQGIFDRADANTDGLLTRDELTQASEKQQSVAAGRSGGGGMMMRFDPVLRALDANQDGSLTSEEWNSAPAALAKLDKNTDGQLTIDELRPNFERNGQQRRRRPGQERQ